MPSKYSERTFEFPECWSNDVRMNALFAPFRSKSVNPTDWNSKMKFWTNLIESWCLHNKCPVVELHSLKNSFSRKGVIPACLEDVLDNLSSTGVLILKENFMALNESWKEWAVKVLVTYPIKWTFNAVKDTIIRRDDQKEVFYVHLPVVKLLSENLIKTVPCASKGKLISYEELLKIWEVENEEDLSLVLHWLQKQGLVAVCIENDHSLVKFSKNSSTQVEITEADKGIYNLEKQEKILEENIKKLETDKNAALEETKKHLAAQMKNMAKISLRRKKEIEKTIEKRAVILENIQGILHRIDQLKLDSEVVDCYQKGIKTLKTIFKETGLNEDTVSNTMNELEEVLNSSNEIEEALSRPVDPILDQLVRDELDELLLEEAPKAPTEDLPIDLVVEEKKEKKEEENLGKRMEALSL